MVSLLTSCLRFAHLWLVYLTWFAATGWCWDHTALAGIQGINLDLDGAELAADEVRFFDERDRVLQQDKTIDLDEPSDRVVKYELSERELLNEEKFAYVIERDAKSVVWFRDTKTILVPDDNILSGEEPDVLRYHEVSFGNLDSATPKYESVLIPATSCFRYNGVGAGSVTLGYSVGVQISPQISGSLSYQFTNLALKYSLSYQASITTTFSGSYVCNTDNGFDVRLFYKVGTIEVEPRERSFFYDRYRGVLYNHDWMDMKAIKFLSDHAPIYYCATADKLDLMCDRPGIEFVDESGNTIKSQVKQV